MTRSRSGADGSAASPRRRAHPWSPISGEASSRGSRRDAPSAVDCPRASMSGSSSTALTRRSPSLKTRFSVPCPMQTTLQDPPAAHGRSSSTGEGAGDRLWPVSSTSGGDGGAGELLGALGSRSGDVGAGEGRYRRRPHRPLRRARRPTPLSRRSSSVSRRAPSTVLVAGSTDLDARAEVADGLLRRRIRAQQNALEGRFRPQRAPVVSQILAALDILEEAAANLPAELDRVGAPFEPPVSRLDMLPWVEWRTASSRSTNGRSQR